jgi:RNA polymerase sigma factor (sigma-70 family)
MCRTEPPAVSDAELRERLMNALERLPPRRRNIFLPSRVESWTFQQMADAYGISRKRVQREISRTFYILSREVYQDRRLPFWVRWF